MKIFFKIITLSVLVIICNNAVAQVQNSELWGKNGEKWDAAGRLPDFSFAGYETGIKDIPTFPIKATLGQNGAKPNDGLDDADELQKLINTIATPGTVLIPKGQWNLDKRIYIKRSGVVVKGEDGAEFFMRKSLSQIDKENNVDTSPEEMNYSFFQAFINLEGNIVTKKKADGVIVENAAQGIKQLVVSKNTKVAIGDWIMITQTDDATESLYKYINNVKDGRSFYQNPPKDEILNEKNMFTFYTKVLGKTGDIITIERPMPIKTDTRWNPKVEVLDMEKTTQNIGFQNITLRMNGDAWGGHFKNAGFSGINMIGLMNSWLKDVTIIDADNCIYFHNIAFCTLDGITIKAGKRPNNKDIGHHGIFIRDSARDNLITNFKFEASYLHDLTVEAHATQNVFTHGVGKQLNFDHHRIGPFANLFTEINVGNGNRLMGSSGALYRGPHTGIYTTLWNIQKTSGAFRTLPSSSNSADKIPGGSPAPDWFYMNAIGLQGIKAADGRNQYVEFTNGENFSPKNLYEAQKAKRVSNDKKTSK